MDWLLVDDPHGRSFGMPEGFGLPLAPRTADLLAHVAIYGEDPSLPRRIAKLLHRDPVFLWWLWLHRPTEIVSLTDFANSLPDMVRQAIPLLHTRLMDGGRAGDEWPDQVRSVVALATASALFAKGSLPNPDVARFLVMLQAAPAELANPGEIPIRPTEVAEPANEAVKLAQQVMGSPQHLQGKRARIYRVAMRAGAKARELWLRPARGLGTALPVLLQKLSRLAELEENFAATLEREKLEALAEFAAGAGHEINNPVAVISGRAQLLLRGEQDLERQHDLAVIGFQASRIYEMIADTMLFARPPEPELRQFDLVELVRNVIQQRSERAQRQQVELGWCGSAAELQISGDAVQLGVALRAVIDNALDAVEAGGKIEISLPDVLPASTTHLQNGAATKPQAACIPGKMVRLTIRDSGPGFSAEVRRHLFDPYFSGRQAGRGLGLGMSKCWRIITNHGGQVIAENSPEGGAVVHLDLPISPENASPPASTTAHQQDAT